MENEKKKPIIDFEELADKQVGAIYLLMSLFLTVAYALEVVEGSQPFGFLIAFVTADWGAFIVSLCQKISGKIPEYTPMGSVYRIFPVLHPDFIQFKKPVNLCLYHTDYDYHGLI